MDLTFKHALWPHSALSFRDDGMNRDKFELFSHKRSRSNWSLNWCPAAVPDRSRLQGRERDSRTRTRTSLRHRLSLIDANLRGETRLL